MRVRKKRWQTAILAFTLSLLAPSLESTQIANAANCTKAPDAPILKVKYPASLSGPVFTAYPAITGDPARKISISYSLFKKGGSQWSAWNQTSDWVDIDSTIVKNGIGWDSAELNAQDIQAVSISVGVLNDCSSSNTSFPSTSYGYSLFFQDRLLNSVSSPIKIYFDYLVTNTNPLVIKNFYRLSIAGGSPNSITPSICSASSADENSPGTPFAVIPLREGECIIEVTSSDPLIQYSAQLHLLLVKPVVYHYLDYGRYKVTGSVGSYVYFGGNSSPNNIGDIVNYRFSLKVQTPTICASTPDKSKLALALKSQSYLIKGLKPGTCILQITDPETPIIRGATYSVPITFTKGKPIDVKSDMKYFCTRAVERVISVAEYLTPCPAGYNQSESFTQSQIIPVTP